LHLQSRRHIYASRVAANVPQTARVHAALFVGFSDGI
jgi:hypothetical protein